MKRYILLAVTIVFLLGLSFLTIYDIVHDGVTPLNVLSILLIAFFGVALIGALTARPPEDQSSGL
jgi:cytochrome c biogenesis protein CcdA